MTRARSHRAILWLLLAAALFVRAFMPQGYMAEREANGSIAVTLCGSGGVHLIPVETRNEGSRDGQRAEPPCAFAGLGSPALPPPAMPTAAPPAPSPAVWQVQRGERTPDAAPRLRPPVRGPPLPA